MDANGTKFHLMLGKDDWGGATPGASEWARLTSRPVRPLSELWADKSEDAELASLRWDSSRNELTLAPLLFQFSPSPKDNMPQLSDRRGAGRDRFGNWYWISDTEQEILVNSAGTATTSRFWSTADCAGCETELQFGGFGPVQPEPAPTALHLRGLAVTDDHYLVVGVLQPSGLLIFDLHAGGGPLQIVWPEEVRFTPFDFAARPGGGVWILDRDFTDDAKAPRYWALDRHFNIQSRNPAADAATRELFQPLSGESRKSAARISLKSLDLAAASPLVALDAIAIEALPDDTVLILVQESDRGFSRIYRFRFDEQLGEPVETEKMRTLIEGSERPWFTLVAHDFSFVPEHDSSGEVVPDRIYVVDRKGNQSFAFNIALDKEQVALEALPAYLPMRLFGGKGLVAAGGQPYYDFADRWIPLVEQPRPRYETDATLETPVFDGAEPDCRWHRLTLDACISPEADVEIWSRAANEERDLAFTEWLAEPELYRRGDGSEQPFVSRPTATARSAAVDYGTWELLLQRARGRFIQLKLRLSGNGRTTPRLRAMRFYYPRFSYLDHYLPAVYREDSQSASFLDRFLANIEGFFTSTEDKIAAVQMLFDVRSIPPEYLDWLAGWFGVVLDPTWDEPRRRLFIGHAMDFFQYRGTILGLKCALRLAFDKCADASLFDLQSSIDPRSDSIRIVESYRTRSTPGVALGDPTSIGSAAVGFAQVSPSSKWHPQDGRSDLYQRYAAFLAARFSVAALSSVVTFSLRPPDWQKLVLSGVTGQVPPAESNDAILWGAFLKNRYSTTDALSAAHGKDIRSFSDATLPATLLPSSAELTDWNAFVNEKSAAWTDFASQALGFVPQSGASERGLWGNFLAARYLTIDELNQAYGASYAGFDNVALPAAAPSDGKPREDWDEFRRATAGSVASSTRVRWQDFLARRYRRIGGLNEAYGTAWNGFDDIALFDELPLRETALADWFQFEAVVLAMQAAAHRFTVLLPAPLERPVDQTEFRQQRDLATRIVSWEKPAHTIFDVKFYWSLFRVGGARLGFDTLLDVGSRAPELLTPMVLGEGYLAETYVSDERNLSGRQVIGGNALVRRKSAEQYATN